MLNFEHYYCKGQQKHWKFDSKIGKELKNLVTYSCNSLPNLLLRITNRGFGKKRHKIVANEGFSQKKFQVQGVRNIRKMIKPKN